MAKPDDLDLKQSKALHATMKLLDVLSGVYPSLGTLLSYGSNIGAEPVITAAMGILAARQKSRRQTSGERAIRPELITDILVSGRCNQPDAPPRKLRAFAKRAEMLAESAGEMFGYELPDLQGLATVANVYADRYESDPSTRTQKIPVSPVRTSDPHRRGGRNLSPETPLADALDVILELIPTGERHALIGQLLAEFFGTENAGAEQVRSRIRDYRRNFGSRPHN